MTDKDRSSRFVWEPDDLVIEDEPDDEETWEYDDSGQPITAPDSSDEDGDDADE